MGGEAPKRGSKRERGFTMIEALVSLAIMGLMASLLLAAIAGTSLIAQRTDRMAFAGAEIASAQQVLRGSIGGLRPLERVELHDQTLDIQGSEHALDFDGRPRDRDGPDALQRYRLLLTSPGDLVLFSANELSNTLDVRAPLVVGWNATKLLSGVVSLSISYFGTTPPDTEPGWHNDWQDQKQSPTLVRVRIGFPASDPRRWPDLVIRPAALAVPCTIDPLTHRCQQPI